LVGEKVRYNAEHKKIQDRIFEKWIKEGRLISICPEMAGGLPTPRPPSEIIQSRVLTKTGEDVTQQFKRGAEISLQQCQAHGMRMAILKAKSPSCGNNEIYDGTFSGRTILGSGVTANLLQRTGIRVFNENQILEAEVFLQSLLCVRS
jgi:uncharacterized protein YbbK (DUF523 family)